MVSNPTYATFKVRDIGLELTQPLPFTIINGKGSFTVNLKNKYNTPIVWSLAPNNTNTYSIRILKSDNTSITYEITALTKEKISFSFPLTATAKQFQAFETIQVTANIYQIQTAALINFETVPDIISKRIIIKTYITGSTTDINGNIYIIGVISDIKKKINATVDNTYIFGTLLHLNNNGNSQVNLESDWSTAGFIIKYDHNGNLTGYSTIGMKEYGDTFPTYLQLQTLMTAVVVDNINGWLYVSCNFQGNVSLYSLDSLSFHNTYNNGEKQRYQALGGGNGPANKDCIAGIIKFNISTGQVTDNATFYCKAELISFGTSLAIDKGGILYFSGYYAPNSFIFIPPYKIYGFYNNNNTTYTTYTKFTTSVGYGLFIISYDSIGNLLYFNSIDYASIYAPSNFHDRNDYFKYNYYKYTIDSGVIIAPLGNLLALDEDGNVYITGTCNDNDDNNILIGNTPSNKRVYLISSTLYDTISSFIIKYRPDLQTVIEYKYIPPINNDSFSIISGITYDPVEKMLYILANFIYNGNERNFIIYQYNYYDGNSSDWSGYYTSGYTLPQFNYWSETITCILKYNSNGPINGISVLNIVYGDIIGTSLITDSSGNFYVSGTYSSFTTQVLFEEANRDISNIKQKKLAIKNKIPIPPPPSSDVINVYPISLSQEKAIQPFPEFLNSSNVSFIIKYNSLGEYQGVSYTVQNINYGMSGFSYLSIDNSKNINLFGSFSSNLNNELYTIGPISKQSNVNTVYVPLLSTSNIRPRALISQFIEYSPCCAAASNIHITQGINQYRIDWNADKNEALTYEVTAGNFTMNGLTLSNLLPEQKKVNFVKLSPYSIQDLPRILPNTNITQAMAISGNGRVALIGAPNDYYHGNKIDEDEYQGNKKDLINNPTPGDGNIYLFDYTSNSWWNRYIDTLYDQEKLNGVKGNYGNAVGLNYDGTIAIVGTSNLNNIGSVYILNFKDNYSFTSYDPPVPIDNDGKANLYNMYFGSAVAISGDGETALIGGPNYSRNDINIGSAFLYTYGHPLWESVSMSTYGMDSTLLNQHTRNYFGTSVGLNYDGTVAVVGAPGDRTGNVIVYNLYWQSSNLLQVPDFFNNGDNFNMFGMNIALNYDGTRAIVSSSNNKFPSLQGYPTIYDFNSISADKWFLPISPHIIQLPYIPGLSNIGNYLSIGADINTVIFNGYQYNLPSSSELRFPISSIAQYPPVNMTTYNFMHNDITYTATASSEAKEPNKNYHAYYVFNSDEKYYWNYWKSDSTYYAQLPNTNVTLLDLDKNNYRTISYSGEWVQIQLSEPIVLAYYSLECTNGKSFRFSIVASNDTITWYIIDNNYFYSTLQSINNSIEISTSYLYYRIIITRVYSPPVVLYASIGKWKLYGYKSNILTGNSVALSYDGLTAIVGAPNYNYGDGSVTIYKYQLNEWKVYQQYYGSNMGNGYFGQSVAISGDASTILVSAPNNDTCYIYCINNQKEYPPQSFPILTTEGFKSKLDDTYTLIVTNNSYGNGIYKVSASSDNFVQTTMSSGTTITTAGKYGNRLSSIGLGRSYYAFTYNYNLDWISLPSYDSITGKSRGYKSFVPTTEYRDSNNPSVTVIVHGEWLQIQLPQPIMIIQYSLQAGNGELMAGTFIILGSNDGKNWILVDEQLSAVSWTDNQIQNFTVKKVGIYSYYRYIALSLNPLPTEVEVYPIYTSVGKWKLYEQSIIIKDTDCSLQSYENKSFGKALALNYDGSKALIGIPEGGLKNKGEVAYISLSNQAYSFTQLASPQLYGANLSLSSQFGWDVALSDDGNTAVISAPKHQNIGYVARYTYNLNINKWDSINVLPIDKSLIIQGNRIGWSVAINSNASKIIVSTINPILKNGYVAIYSFEKNQFSTPRYINTEDPYVNNSSKLYNTYGISVGMSSDGNMVVSTGYQYHMVNKYSPYTDTWSNIARGEYANVYTSQSLLLTGRDMFNPLAMNLSGPFAAISGNASSALIGVSSLNNYTGYATIYDLLKVSIHPIINTQGIVTNTSLSGNANILLGGISQMNTNKTTGYAFIQSTSITTDNTTVVYSEPDVIENIVPPYAIRQTLIEFGNVLALSDDGKTAIVGVINSGNYNIKSKIEYAVYVYRFKNNAWTLDAHSDVFNLQNIVSFSGLSVNISGDGNTIIIGAYPTSLNNNGGGYAVIYRYNLYTLSWGDPYVLTLKQNTQSQYSFAVSLNYDGTIAIVSGPNNYIGIYHYNNNYNNYNTDATSYSLDSTIVVERVYTIIGESITIDSGGNNIYISADSKNSADSTIIILNSNLDPTYITIKDYQELFNYYFSGNIQVSGDGSKILIGAYSIVYNKNICVLFDITKLDINQYPPIIHIFQNISESELSYSLSKDGTTVALVSSGYYHQSGGSGGGRGEGYIVVYNFDSNKNIWNIIYKYRLNDKGTLSLGTENFVFRRIFRRISRPILVRLPPISRPILLNKDGTVLLCPIHNVNRYSYIITKKINKLPTITIKTRDINMNEGQVININQQNSSSIPSSWNISDITKIRAYNNNSYQIELYNQYHTIATSTTNTNLNKLIRNTYNMINGKYYYSLLLTKITPKNNIFHWNDNLLRVGICNSVDPDISTNGFNELQLLIRGERNSWYIDWFGNLSSSVVSVSRTPIFQIFNSGDIIDIAIDSSISQATTIYAWVRINNGYWNNSPDAHPEFNIGGYNTGINKTRSKPYNLVVAPWTSANLKQNNFDTIITINTISQNIPDGFQFIG